MAKIQMQKESHVEKKEELKNKRQIQKGKNKQLQKKRWSENI